MKLASLLLREFYCRMCHRFARVKHAQSMEGSTLEAQPSTGGTSEEYNSLNGL